MLKCSLMVESLLEILTKRTSLKFYTLIDVLSVTSVLGVSKHVILLKVKFTGNINHCCFNFLFELPSKMPLIGSYLLPSFSLVTLEKIVLIEKVYNEIN